MIYLATYGYGLNFPESPTDLGAEMCQTVAANNTTTQSPIHFVDHRIGWNKTIHSDETDHPSEAGMLKMAENWLTAIEFHGN